MLGTLQSLAYTQFRSMSKCSSIHIFPDIKEIDLGLCGQPIVSQPFGSWDDTEYGSLYRGILHQVITKYPYMCITILFSASRKWLNKFAHLVTILRQPTSQADEHSQGVCGVWSKGQSPDPWGMPEDNKLKTGCSFHRHSLFLQPSLLRNWSCWKMLWSDKPLLSVRQRLTGQIFRTSKWSYMRGY